MIAEVSRRRIIVNCASAVTESIFNVAVLFWLNQYLVKRISPEEYSLYPVLASVMVFVPFLSTVLTSGLGRYLAEAHAQQDDRRITQIISTMFPLLLGVSVALLAAGLAFTLHVDRVLTISPGRVSTARFMMFLLFFEVFVRLTLAPFTCGLYVMQRFVLLNTLSVCNVIVRSVLLVGLLFSAGPAVLWLVVATVTADVSTVLITTAISVRLLPALRFRLSEIRWELVGVLTSFGFWNMVMFLAYLIRKSADPLVLNKLATPRDVTSFYLGNLPDNQIETLTQKAMVPLLPAMIAFHAKGQQESMRSVYVRGGRYSLWAVLFFVVPLLVYREDFWSLYLGETYALYRDASAVMALLFARYWLSSPNDMVYKVAHAKGEVRPIAVRCIMTALFNLALTLFLVGFLKMGAVGSAAGTLLAILIWEPLVFWPYGLRLVGVCFAEWARETIWPGILPAVTSGVFMLGVRGLLVPHNWLGLVAEMGVGCSVYLMVLVFFCLKQDEAQTLLQIVARGREMLLATSGVSKGSEF